MSLCKTPVAVKTKKARALAAKEGTYMALRGSAFDAHMGKLILPIDSRSSATNVKKWVADRSRLSASMEIVLADLERL